MHIKIVYIIKTGIEFSECKYAHKKINNYLLKKGHLRDNLEDKKIYGGYYEKLQYTCS